MLDLTTLLVIAIIFAVYVLIVQYCWNNVISPVTNTMNIDFYQTFLLVVLIGTMLHTPLFLSIDF